MGYASKILEKKSFLDSEASRIVLFGTFLMGKKTVLMAALLT